MQTPPPTDDNSTLAIVERLDTIISSILDSKFSPKITIDITLWDTSEVAGYLGLTYKYVSEHIVTHHTFPNAIRFPTKTGNRGYPRWYAGQVIAWAATNQEG